MRERSIMGRRTVASRLWAKIIRRPVDTVAILGAGAATLIIVVNAVCLQSVPNPAPFLANPPQRIAGNPAETSATPTPKLAAPGFGYLQTASDRRNDPIGDLIASSLNLPARIIAVQRALSEYGYGQIRPSGVFDQPTSAAIEKFESEHNLPVTGRLSDPLLRALAVMTGHPIE